MLIHPTSSTWIGKQGKKSLYLQCVYEYGEESVDFVADSFYVKHDGFAFTKSIERLCKLFANIDDLYFLINNGLFKRDVDDIAWFFNQNPDMLLKVLSFDYVVMGNFPEFNQYVFDTNVNPFSVIQSLKNKFPSDIENERKTLDNMLAMAESHDKFYRLPDGYIRKFMNENGWKEEELLADGWVSGDTPQERCNNLAEYLIRKLNGEV